MFKEDATVIHFNNPKVQASLAANTFAVTGHAEYKKITEMVPGILNQLNLNHLKPAGNTENTTGNADDDEVPDLMGNFDEAAKAEGN